MLNLWKNFPFKEFKCEYKKYYKQNAFLALLKQEKVTIVFGSMEIQCKKICS